MQQPFGESPWLSDQSQWDHPLWQGSAAYWPECSGPSTRSGQWPGYPGLPYSTGSQPKALSPAAVSATSSAEILTKHAESSSLPQPDQCLVLLGYFLPVLPWLVVSGVLWSLLHLWYQGVGWSCSPAGLCILEHWQSLSKSQQLTSVPFSSQPTLS